MFSAALTNLCQQQPQVRRLWVAYSGGMDSQALLHWLVCHTPEGYDLQAVHVHHGLQTVADEWVLHCQAQCRALGVPLQVRYVHARPQPGESPEAAARSARYRTLSELLDARSALLTAQHQDDQAETLLLALARGSGVAGLAAMPSSTRLGRGWLWRPLLDVGRTQLERYARAHKLQWVEDPTNQDLRYARNHLRLKVVPALRQYWPQASVTLARSAAHCAEAAELLDDLAAQDFARIHSDSGGLFIDLLSQLTPARQRNLLRYWLRQHGLPLPDQRRLWQLQQQMHSAADRQPHIHWPGAEVRRYQGQLYASVPLPELPKPARWLWAKPLQHPLHLPWQSLRLDPCLGVGISARMLGEQPLEVRLRQGGERFCPAGRARSQELKKLLQGLAIPPWERNRLVLLYAGESLVWVEGIGVDKAWMPAQGNPGWLPVVEHPV